MFFLEAFSQPEVQFVDLLMKLFPEKRKMNYEAKIKLFNNNSQPIDLFHI